MLRVAFGYLRFIPIFSDDKNPWLNKARFSLIFTLSSAAAGYASQQLLNDVRTRIGSE
jgi:hypothetical protein